MSTQTTPIEVTPENFDDQYFNLLRARTFLKLLESHLHDLKIDNAEQCTALILIEAILEAIESAKAANGEMHTAFKRLYLEKTKLHAWCE